MIKCADLFCGGGGTSTGMIEAFKKAGLDYSLIGINHWDVAIQTNKLNHKGDYYCASIYGVEPTDVVKGGVLDILWASPECTNHSRAKGGIPRQNQSRCQPEILLTWLSKLVVKRMYIENVVEFREWGPLLGKEIEFNGKIYKMGFPDPRKKGLIFRDFIKAIKARGYKVDWRILNAADYGAPTCRERLIIQAVKIGTGEKIVWPMPTHAKEPGLFNEKPWVPAKDIIDWSIKGESIFNRKHPLAENTLKRIENGIRKYWGQWAEPFLIMLRGTDPKQLGRSSQPLTLPIPTITANGTHIGLVRPFLTHYHGGEGGEKRTSGIMEPLPVCDCSNRYGLVEPLFIPQQSAGTVKPVTNPLPTISTAGAISLVEPLIQAYYGNNDQCKPVSRTLDTITTKDRFGLLEGKLLKMSNGETYKLDITFRMLQPHELAAAMSFPKNYKFCGNKTEQIRQIGNAVCPKLSECLISAALSA